MKTYSGKLTSLPGNGIFVFGSNTQGFHKSGAAKAAIENFGAVYGKAYGLQGQSYAIITKDKTKDIHPSISKDTIKMQIAEMYLIAAVRMPKFDFYVAYGVNEELRSGFTPNEMAEMFACTAIPQNIVFEENFAKLVQYYLNHGRTKNSR